MSIATASGRRISVAAIVLVAAVYVIYAWDRLVVPIELVEIRATYHFSPASAGLLASVFTFGLALMAIPAGLVVLRFGTRATLVAGAVLFSLCTAYTPVGFAYADLVAARIGSGIGEGLYNVALFTFLGRLSAKYRGTANGLAASLFGLGMFLGPIAVSWLLIATGSWRSPFFILAGLGILGAIGIAAALKGHEDERQAAGPAEPMAQRLARMLRWRNVAVCAVMAVNGLGIYSFISIYETFLRTDQHFDLPTASLIFSLFGIGNILGGVPMGYVADRVGRRRFLVAATIANAILGAAAYSIPPWPVAAMAVDFVLGAFMNGMYTNCYALIQDQAEPQDMPLATGVLATIYFLMAAISGYALVTAKNAFGWTPAAILIYTIPYLAAALILACLRPARATAAPVATPHLPGRRA